MSASTHLHFGEKVRKPGFFRETCRQIDKSIAAPAILAQIAFARAEILLFSSSHRMLLAKSGFAHFRSMLSQFRQTNLNIMGSDVRP